MTDSKKLIAKTIAGLEEVLAEELSLLGAGDVEILNRAVAFEGDKRLLYKANYCSRTALRILSPLFSFHLADEDDLYSQITGYPWEEILEVSQTLAIDSVVSDSELTHSHYVALRAKDAIVDRFRERNNGRRPSVELDNPDIRINIHINGSTCDVSLDSSGISLHKRGYRVSNAEAPMSEVLAAGLILLSNWDRKSHFIDPMCGSGTLLIEAAMIANNFPAGMYRKSFGFMSWKDFDAELWKEVVEEANDQQTEFEYLILGNDISPKNLSSARANIKSAKLHKDIQLHTGPFSELEPPAGEPGMIIINPPYGERIKTGDIIGLYKEIGDTLKKHFTGYNAWVISSDHYALKSVGLKASRKVIIWNGPLECRYAGFELYEGTRKQLEYTDQEPVEENFVSDRMVPEAGTEQSQDFENDEVVDKPARREDRPDKPFRRDDKGDRPFSREKGGDRSDRPFRRDDKGDRPFSREKRGDRSDKPFRKDDKGDRPFNRERREDRPDKPFRRDDQGDRPFSRGKREDRPDRPFRKDDKGDRPFSRERREDRPDKPFRRDDKGDRSFSRERREDRPDKPFRRDDKGDRPFSREKREDRPDKPFRRDDKGDRPFSREKREDHPDKPFRKDHPTPDSRKKDEKKEVIVYQPQNRFEKPEKAYRRKNGKANEGDPSGSKAKSPKKKRPRKED